MPRILAKIYEAVPPGPQDWCSMAMPASNADDADVDAAGRNKDKDKSHL